MTDTIDTTALVAFYNEILSAKNADGTPSYEIHYRMTAANHVLTLATEAKKQ